MVRAGAFAAVAICVLVAAACGARDGEDGILLRVVAWKPDDRAVWGEVVSDFEASHSGVRVRFELGPNSSTALHDLLTQKLRNRDPSVDAFLMDVVWPAEFAAAGWALALDDRWSEDDRGDFFPGTVEAQTWEGSVYGVPFNTDAGLLYFRTDLLERYGFGAPSTWEELRPVSAHERPGKSVVPARDASDPAKADAARRVEDSARLLSGGERQRVAIGRAIVRDPRLFLFDEPLSNLDACLRAEMRLEIARLHRRLGKAMVYVTHDQVEALTLGERIAVLRAGRVEQVGSPEDVHDRPATPFVATFVGTPGMNLLEGRLEGGRSVAGAFALPLDGSDGPVELGFRPDRAHLGGDHGRGVVELIENLGSERYAHLRVEGAGRLVVRLAAGERPQAEEEVPFQVDPAAVHLFSGGRRVGAH